MKTIDAQFLPVVQRELREGARRPFNYWLRVGGATAGVLLIYSISQTHFDSPSEEGMKLFTGLHLLILGLIVAVVPAMSADCIAREKREGTLGLLFLTPLNGFGIVLGKGLMQAFRAFTLWLAVLPVLVIPFVSGGITWPDVFSALTIELCVTLLALSAGILASSAAQARSMAFVLAEGIGAGLVALFAGLLGLVFTVQTLAPGQPLILGEVFRAAQYLVTGQSSGFISMVSFPGVSISSRWTIVSRIYSPMGFQQVVILLPDGSRQVISVTTTSGMPLAASPFGWSAYFSRPATRHVWPPLLIESLVTGPLFCYVVLKISAWQAARGWHDSVPSARRESWIKTFCLPRKKGLFAKRMLATLEWNPIAWLQLYSWKSRLSKWGLCLGFVFLECMANAISPTAMLEAQDLILLVFVATFTFTGVNSFLTEKKTGALELLLVTPLSPNRIIFGRVFGLWLQFLPAGLAFVLLWLYARYCLFSTDPWQMFQPGFNGSGMVLRHLTAPFAPVATPWVSQPSGIPGMGYGFWERMPTNDPTFQVFVLAMGFLTLPVFATYFALRIKNLIVAAALTLLALYVCRAFAFYALDSISGGTLKGMPPGSLYGGVFLAHFGFALLACFLLRHSLSRRIYSF